MEELIARVNTLLCLDKAPEEALVLELLRQGEALILSYTGRASLPPGLESGLVRLAVVLYNRLGTEGESWRHEGGLMIRFSEFPPMLLHQLRAWRVGRIP